jgi:hypothetical protein
MHARLLTLIYIDRLRTLSLNYFFMRKITVRSRPWRENIDQYGDRGGSDLMPTAYLISHKL